MTSRPDWLQQLADAAVDVTSYGDGHAVAQEQSRALVEAADIVIALAEWNDGDDEMTLRALLVCAREWCVRNTP